MSRASTWKRVYGKFGGNRSKESGRSGASYTTQKKQRLCPSATHFFALSPKPIARFRWKRARLSLFRPQPYLPSFNQIHPSFRDLLAKTTFQIVTIIKSAIPSEITHRSTKKPTGSCVEYLFDRDQRNTTKPNLQSILVVNRKFFIPHTFSRRRRK